MKTLSSRHISKVFEVNAKNWFNDYIEKTVKFLDVWTQKGNDSIDVDQSKGSIQSNKEKVQLTFNDLSRTFTKYKIYKTIYPQTDKYIKQYQNLRPDNIDKEDWENILIQMSVYTPKPNYEGENYPVSFGIIPAQKIELIEGFFHVHSFESSELIKNSGEVDKVSFEAFIDNIRQKFKGITITAPVPTIYKKYVYKGKRFESTDINNILKLEF